MQGRLLATAGNVRAADYIANELKRLGLTPMGDNGTFFQAVNIVDRALDESTRLSVGSTSFAPWTDYIVRDQGDGARSLDGVQVIYGGTWGDSATLIDPAAAAGKLVLLSVSTRVPAGGIPGAVARGAATSRFSQAAGIAAAGLDLMPPQMQALLRQASQSLKPEGAAPTLPTFMYVTKRVASALLGSNVDSAKTGAVGLTVTATPRYKETPVEFPVRNVVAMIQGSDPSCASSTSPSARTTITSALSARPVAHDSMYIVNHLFRTGGADDARPQLDATQQAQVNPAGRHAPAHRRRLGAPGLDLQRRRRRRLGQDERAGDRAVLRARRGEAEALDALRLAHRRRSRAVRLGILHRPPDRAARLDRRAAQHRHDRPRRPPTSRGTPRTACRSAAARATCSWSARGGCPPSSATWSRR